MTTDRTPAKKFRAQRSAVRSIQPCRPGTRAIQQPTPRTDRANLRKAHHVKPSATSRRRNSSCFACMTLIAAALAVSCYARDGRLAPWHRHGGGFPASPGAVGGCHNRVFVPILAPPQIGADDMHHHLMLRRKSVRITVPAACRSPRAPRKGADPVSGFSTFSSGRDCSARCAGQSRKAGVQAYDHPCLEQCSMSGWTPAPPQATTTPRSDAAFNESPLHAPKAGSPSSAKSCPPISAQPFNLMVAVQCLKLSFAATARPVVVFPVPMKRPNTD